ncbi:MAG: sigma-70 family RNA polymerase sigma factor [Planctomycetales bacterium]|nr:sigma-70 family RNA polymerase sigma factor [Planctomycetales bacterium]
MNDPQSISGKQARELSVLWTRAHPVVAAFFRSNLRDYHRAEDLLQETAASVAEGFATYDQSRPFVPWVLGVAKNKLLHHLRTQSNDIHTFDESLVREVADAYAAMSDELATIKDALEICAERVSGRSRKLLEMRYVRDLTPAKIAARTGMNANAVAVMLHRVRKALRECIERQLDSKQFRQLRPEEGVN